MTNLTGIEHLLEFASTPREREKLEAIIAHGGQRAAARALGITKGAVDHVVKRVKQRAALQGVSPEHDMTKAVPVPYVVKGTSTLYKDGQEAPALQWVKTDLHREQYHRMLVETLQASFEDHLGLAHKVAKPKTRNDGDLLTVYPMGDPHIGMYAWGEEAGEDFDTERASRQLRTAVHDLVARSPNSHTAVVLNLGDFYHSDSLENRTMRSGNVLDVDTRWPKVLRVGVDLMIDCVYAALAKHRKVIVKNVVGNHDDHSATFLTIALEKYFHNEKRVHVDNSPAPFWFYRFGSVLIGSTHGDKTKPRDLPGIMAALKPDDWGESRFRYWYTGHIHSKHAEEFPGCLWESFRTLAAKDAWHAGKGYISGRDMTAITHHARVGEIERHVFNIAQMAERDRVLS